MSRRTSQGPADLLVIGGGMAGLSAAARAADEGASVVLVEKATRTGGSAEYAGFIWTAPTLAVMREVNPGGDPALAERLVEGYPEAIDWVGSLGVDIKPPVRVLGFGRGCQTDMPQLLTRCEQMIRASATSDVMLGADTERLLIEDGRVAGAEVVSATGEHRAIEARHRRHVHIRRPADRPGRRGPRGRRHADPRPARRGRG